MIFNFWFLFKQVLLKKCDLLYGNQRVRCSRPGCSVEKVFWKYAVNLRENTHAEV